MSPVLAIHWVLLPVHVFCSLSLFSFFFLVLASFQAFAPSLSQASVCVDAAVFVLNITLITPQRSAWVLRVPSFASISGLIASSLATSGVVHSIRKDHVIDSQSWICPASSAV